MWIPHYLFRILRLNLYIKLRKHIYVQYSKVFHYSASWMWCLSGQETFNNSFNNTLRCRVYILCTTYIFLKIYLFLFKQGWSLTTQSELLHPPPPPIWLQPPSFIWSLYASLRTKKNPWRKLRRTMLMPSAAIYLYWNRMPHRIFKEIFQNSFPNNLTEIPNIQG